MSAPLYPAGGPLLQPNEEILWWLRPATGGSRRSYLLRRFTRPVVAFGIAGLAVLLTVLVALPLLRGMRGDVTVPVLPLLAGAGLVIASGVLLAAVGLLALLIPEPACPPPPRVVSDLLYVITDRRLLVVRASRGSGRAYAPDDLAPIDGDAPVFRIDPVAPGVGNVLIGVAGPAGWISRMSLWQVSDPDLVAARLRSWAGQRPEEAETGAGRGDEQAAGARFPINPRRRARRSAPVEAAGRAEAEVPATIRGHADPDGGPGAPDLSGGSPPAWRTRQDQTPSRSRSSR